MKKGRRVVGIISVITFILAMIHMCHGIHVLLDPQTFTSFPWTWACVVTAILFGPILVLELVVYLVLTVMIHRKKNTESS